MLSNAEMIQKVHDSLSHIWGAADRVKFLQESQPAMCELLYLSLNFSLSLSLSSLSLSSLSLSLSLSLSFSFILSLSLSLSLSAEHRRWSHS